MNGAPSLRALASSDDAFAVMSFILFNTPPVFGDMPEPRWFILTFHWKLAARCYDLRHIWDVLRQVKPSGMTPYDESDAGCTCP